MNISRENCEIERPELAEAAFERYAHTALILGLWAAGLASVYFAVLFAITH